MKKKAVFVAVSDDASTQEIVLAIQQDPTLILTGIANTVAAAIESIEVLPPDLLIIDIRLPEGGGFRLLELTGRYIPAIFIDDDAKLALRSFAHNTIDYLIKPVSTFTIRRAINKYKQWNSTLLHDVLSQTAPLTITYPKKILVESGSKKISISVNDIVYFKADRDYCWIYTSNDDMYLSSYGISELEKRLDPNQFLRVHRSYIVNTDQIRELYRDISKTFVLLQNNVEISVGRRFVSNLRELVF